MAISFQIGLFTLVVSLPILYLCWEFPTISSKNWQKGSLVKGKIVHLPQIIGSILPCSHHLEDSINFPLVF